MRVAAGVTVEWIREKLRGLSKYDVPRHVESEMRSTLRGTENSS